jgi:hypothetical protein
MEAFMTTLPFKLSVDPAAAQFLLTVRGEMAPPDVETGRKVHNVAAGSDQAVATARSFGDLSHAVFVPVQPNGSGVGELLIIDYWNSPQGMQSFFAAMPPPTKETQIFKDREAVLWQSTPGLPSFNLPAPTGRNERYVGLARGKVNSRESAEKILTEALRKGANTSRAKGLMSREWYFRMMPPGEKPSLEAIGVDVWFDADGMKEVYADSEEMGRLAGLFAEAPALSVWQKPKGQWVEW